MALMLLLVLMSLLSKSPKSSIGSESGVLNGWVNWIIVVNVFLIVRFITVGKFVGGLHTMALMLHSLVMFFLGKSPESSVSTESGILDGRITWIIIVNIFLIVRFVSISELVRVLKTVALMLHSMLMSLLSKGPESSICAKSSILDRRINWIIIINIFLIIGFVTVSKLIRILNAMASAMASALPM